MTDSDIKHLYIHWPFCKQKCSYCDFASFAGKEHLVDSYHEMLCKEVKEFANGQTIKTIFFGGGTPSIYPLHLLERLFAVLQQNMAIDDAEEITLEANPETITQEKLKLWKQMGINRLSIGVQTLDETTLKRLGRNQTNKSVLSALEQAATYFDNISIDLILGLPEISQQTWQQQSLNLVKTFPISHVSVYFLTLYENTPLAQQVTAGNIALPDEKTILEYFEKTIDFLESHDFTHYEVSNFARPDRESIHNKAYWNRAAYRGFGLHAASFIGKRRFVNTKSLQHYLQAWHTNRSVEILSDEQIMLEELMLGLRQKTGMDLRRVVYFLHKSKQELFQAQLEALQNQNLIRVCDDRIFLTRRGIILENEIVIRLANIF